MVEKSSKSDMYWLLGSRETGVGYDTDMYWSFNIWEYTTNDERRFIIVSLKTNTRTIQLLGFHLIHT